VAGLRVRRLDLLRNELTVAEQIIRGKGGVSFPGSPKSRAGRRTMTMPGWLTEILAEHLHQRGLAAADGDAWVFDWPSGAHLSYSAWRKHWLRATSEAGLPAGFGFHDLRRANATGLVSSGVDIRTAQSRLGHADVRMTLEIYARATNEATGPRPRRSGGCSTRSGSSARTSHTWRGMDAGSKRTAGSRGIAAG